MLRFFFLVQKNLGLTIAGVGTPPPQFGAREERFDMVPVQQCVSRDKFADTTQGVLYDARNGFDCLGGYNLSDISYCASGSRQVKLT